MVDHPQHLQSLSAVLLMKWFFFLVRSFFFHYTDFLERLIGSRILSNLLIHTLDINSLTHRKWYAARKLQQVPRTQESAR